MSISMLLLPMAIAISLTVAGAAASQVEQKKKTGSRYTHLAPMQTIFIDKFLLQQTLTEHGFSVNVTGENQLVCQAGEAHLVYSRYAEGSPFWVTVSGVQNIDRFIAEMNCFEHEYKQNVQSFTYKTLVENMKKTKMRIASETVLEDDSILLTIDI